LSPDCIAALLVAGRCQLLIRRIDRANNYFSKALAINPRTPAQKELGWISMEQGKLPVSISLLTDHLQRNAADYEAYNLLLKCFYLTDRFEAGKSLAYTLMNEKVPNDCFRNNLLLCLLLNGDCAPDELKKHISPKESNPFIVYNLAVESEEPSSWDKTQPATLKPKLVFEEYRFGTTSRANSKNTLAVYTADDIRHDCAQSIVTIGSLSANDIVLKDNSVSRRHCVIVNYSKDVWLYDLGSTVGTMIDGQRLVGRIFLDGVHQVVIGKVNIRIAASNDLLI
jgi:hypothetical protein